MANVCKICSHPQKLEIDRLIAGGKQLRAIARQFSIHHSSVTRHINKCIPLILEGMRAEAKKERAIVVEAEINRVFARLNKLIDACDAWLTDPDDPSIYTLDARATELLVIYEDGNDLNDRGEPRRKRDNLSKLLTLLNKEAKVDALTITTKSADPRDLIVKTAGQIKEQLELFARLQGLFQRDRANESDRVHDREMAAIVKAEVEKLIKSGCTKEEALGIITEVEPDALKWVV